jgi:hypothetical protein
MTKLLALSLIAISVFSLPVDAQARSTVLNDTGPIIIKGPIDCEHKMIKKCHWNKDGKLVCEWVVLPDCEIF